MRQQELKEGECFLKDSDFTEKIARFSVGTALEE